VTGIFNAIAGGVDGRVLAQIEDHSALAGVQIERPQPGRVRQQHLVLVNNRVKDLPQRNARAGVAVRVEQRRPLRAHRPVHRQATGGDRIARRRAGEGGPARGAGGRQREPIGRVELLAQQLGQLAASAGQRAGRLGVALGEGGQPGLCSGPLAPQSRQQHQPRLHLGRVGLRVGVTQASPPLGWRQQLQQRLGPVEVAALVGQVC
jgi:hypothetical protein